jgi:hypothetical protein
MTVVEICGERAKEIVDARVVLPAPAGPSIAKMG